MATAQPAAESLPPRQVHPAAWLGPEMAAQPERWTWTLDAEAVAEVERAAGDVLARGGGDGLAAGVRSPDDFPLPTLGPRLQQLRRELQHGRGFELLKGLHCAQTSSHASVH